MRPLLVFAYDHFLFEKSSFLKDVYMLTFKDISFKYQHSKMNYYNNQNI